MHSEGRVAENIFHTSLKQIAESTLAAGDLKKTSFYSKDPMSFSSHQQSNSSSSNNSSSSSNSKSTAEIFKAAHVRAGVPPRRLTTASGTVRRAKSWPTPNDIKELEKNNFYMMAGAPVSDNSHHIICSNESTSAASKGYATFVKTRLMSYATNSANTNTVLTKMGKLDKYGIGVIPSINVGSSMFEK